MLQVHSESISRWYWLPCWVGQSVVVWLPLGYPRHSLASIA